jgi:hypothetical protein
MTASWARGGRLRYWLGDGTVDDDAVSVMAQGAQHHGRGEDDIVAGSGMTSQALGWRLCGRWCP